MSFDEPGLSDAGSDRFIPAQPESRPPAQTPSWGSKRCPACQTPVLHNQMVCAECGTRLAPRITRIRCLRCRKRATSDHVICPHCGRELRAAPSRLLTAGVPALLLGALAVTLIARDAPSFLRDNDSLPLIQNFEITPVVADSEPNVRPARDSLAPAVVQSGVGQAAGSPPSGDAPPSDAPPTDTPTPQASDTAAGGNAVPRFRQSGDGNTDGTGYAARGDTYDDSRRGCRDTDALALPNCLRDTNANTLADYLYDSAGRHSSWNCRQLRYRYGRTDGSQQHVRSGSKKPTAGAGDRSPLAGPGNSNVHTNSNARRHRDCNAARIAGW